MNNMVIYRDIGSIIISTKIPHIKKIGGRGYTGFCEDNGDVPVANFNTLTKEIEDVVNNRGRGYAHRNAKRFRNKKGYNRKKIGNARSIV